MKPQSYSRTLLTVRGRALSTHSEAKPSSVQLAGFVAMYDPAVGRLVRAARAAMRRRLPTAREPVYDNYQSLAIG